MNNRPKFCLVCGRALAVSPVGRARLTCSDACRQRESRRRRVWEREAYRAVRADLPAPVKSWRTSAPVADGGLFGRVGHE